MTNVAETIDAMMREAGWQQSTFKATGEPAPFYREEGDLKRGGHFIINGHFGAGDHAGVGGASEGFTHTDPVALAQYLIDIGAREKAAMDELEADLVRRAGLMASLMRKPVPPAPAPVIVQTVEVDTPAPLAELESLRARNAELEARLVEQATVETSPPEPSSVDMPDALGEFAEADEDVATLKARFFKELCDLRSMAVSKHPDFIGDKPRLLNILESDVAQRWMLSAT